MATMARGNQPMKDWLAEHLNANDIQGLHWVNKAQRSFRLPWVHQSCKDWQEQSNDVCLKWEQYRGRKVTSIKRAKATFRMSINSIKRRGQVELTSKHSRKSDGGYLVYRFTSFVNVRPKKKAQQSNRESKPEPRNDGEEDIPTIVNEAAEREAIPGHLYQGKRTPKACRVKRKRLPSGDFEPGSPMSEDMDSTSSDDDQTMSYTYAEWQQSDGVLSERSSSCDSAEVGDLDELDAAEFDALIDVGVQNFQACEAILREDPEFCNVLPDDFQIQEEVVITDSAFQGGVQTLTVL